MRRARRVALLSLGAALGCAPRLAPLSGVATPVALPATAIAPGSQRLLFSWNLDDQQLSARGDGVARVTAPDSVRLDFFLTGGLGGGAAVLIGDTLYALGPDLLKRMVPPPALMWAALGRLVVTPLADTVIRSDSGVLHADIGRPVAWRVSFRGRALTRLERVDGGRVQEWVDRTDSAHVRYRNESARRTLDIVITRRDSVAQGTFDPSIWRIGR